MAQDMDWARSELPRWHVNREDSGYMAESPTADVDGIRIWAPDPPELVARVRAFVRVLALAMRRNGKIPPGVIAGVHLSAPTEALEDAPAPRADPEPYSPPPAPTAASDSYEVARAMGYEGDACAECGAMAMVRNGSCLKCMDCGSTNGCS